MTPAKFQFHFHFQSFVFGPLASLSELQCPHRTARMRSPAQCPVAAPKPKTKNRKPNELKLKKK